MSGQKYISKVIIASALVLIIWGWVPKIGYGNGLQSEIIFPFQDQHVHGSTLVELPNGDLLAGWFQGSGERWADDVKIMGARKKADVEFWSDPFLLAEVEAFPDINPVLFVDNKDRLWLMWYTVIANQWETSLIRYRISNDYMRQSGAPVWNWQEVLHVKPGNKTERGIQPDDIFVRSVDEQLNQYGEYLRKSQNLDTVPERWLDHADYILAMASGENMIKSGRVYQDDGTYESRELGYPYFRRMGWQTRNKPFITDTGRIIVPLYSDGFSFSLMAITDNGGETWHFSSPLVGAGNIQPALAVTGEGDLVAYMRDNGPPPKRLHISRSTNDGKTWSLVKDSNIPNPGSGADIVTLNNGHWVLIYNDTEDGRHSLAAAVSEDNGSSWSQKRKIEFDTTDEPTTAHYPAIIHGQDGNLHVTYSFHRPGSFSPHRKTIKYATFSEDWISGN